MHQYTSKALRIVLQGLLFVFVVYFFLAAPGRVNGRSMEMTFSDEDVFIVSPAVYLVRDPQRHDIIQFRDPMAPERLLIKRVIGLPGEKVSIQENHVMITTREGEQKVLNESYLSPLDMTKVSLGQLNHVTVPKESYFVLGDHRLMSTDSRNFGPVSRKLIIGKLLK